MRAAAEIAGAWLVAACLLGPVIGRRLRRNSKTKD